MTFHLNRVELIGRLGQDPDLRYTPSGQAVTTFSVATDRSAKPDGESTTDWHQVVCWEKLAEFTNQYLIKGRLVFLAGRLQYRTWEGKDGQKRRTAEIVASELIALDRKPEPQLQVVNSAADDENLPF
jgi:single-strand DNA-binding protein